MAVNFDVGHPIRYVVSYKRRRMTKNDLFIKILQEVSATNGRIRFGSSTFEVVGAPYLQVNIKNK